MNSLGWCITLTTVTPCVATNCFREPITRRAELASCAINDSKLHGETSGRLISTLNSTANLLDQMLAHPRTNKQVLPSTQDQYLLASSHPQTHLAALHHLPNYGIDKICTLVESISYGTKAQTTEEDK